MTDINAVCDGLAAALGGLGYSPYPVLPGSPDLPAAVVHSPDSIEYHLTPAGHCRITVMVSLIVSRADEEAAQRALRKAISFNVDGSIVNALEATPSTAWRAMAAKSAGPLVEITLGESTKALGIDITLELVA